jgi:hypothetical protein
LSFTLATAITEVQARGFDYLSSARVTQYLNMAMHAVDEEDAWPWLETTTTGTAPLTITDLRAVLYVVDTTQRFPLTGMDVRDVVDMDAIVGTVGTPAFYWLDGMTTLNVYPTNTTDSLSVRYLKYETDLSAGTDTPVIPGRWHGLWIDRAVIECYKDSDNFEQAALLKQTYDLNVTEMRSVVFSRQYDTTGMIARSGA